MAFNPNNYKAPEAKKLPVILLLDVSGSMSGAKIDSLYDATIDMIETFAAAQAKEQREKALAERKQDALKVDEARKNLYAAQKAYSEQLGNFCKKYGTYHYTVENGEEIPSLFDFFGNLLRF